MKTVAKQIQKRKRGVTAHPFFSWLRDCGLPIEDRFRFSPLMVEFIMGFADVNKWFLNYPKPSTALEASINEHTLEDRTHSRLFVEEWSKLRLDEQLGWSVSEMLWWWFDCRETEAFRRLAMETLDLIVNNADPLVRFSMMEAIECVGDVFFGTTVGLARELGNQTGLEYRYYGEYHRVREDGHLHTDESDFLRSRLSDEQRRSALYLVDRMYDMFAEEMGLLLDYSRRLADAPAKVAQDLLDERGAFLSQTDSSSKRWPAGPSRGGRISTTQHSIDQHLRARRERLSFHPFLQWLRRDGDVGPKQKLQRFVPLWAINILGYKDFNRYVLRYSEAGTPAERAINRWTDELASHGALYLRDWLALDLDGALAWPPSKVLHYYFLGDHSEVHRENMAKVKTYAFSQRSPRMRYWLMRALEDGGDVLFRATAPIAHAVEAETGRRLDYWAHRHHAVQPELSPDAEADAVVFTDEDLTASETAIALEIVDRVFDNLEAELALSLRVAEANELAVPLREDGHARESVPRTRSEAPHRARPAVDSVG